MFPRFSRFLCRLGLVCLVSSGTLAQSATEIAPSGVQAPSIRTPKLIADGLGKGEISLDGPWQFHVGDDPSWATPEIEDATGQNGWEELTADKPWGLQGHPNYAGYGWYRKHIDLTPAPGVSPEFALMIPGIDDIYEMYWNGQLIGGLGSFPPRLDYYYGLPPQTYGLGPIRSGVLAFRILKIPFSSVDDGTGGGFRGLPILGSPTSIANLKAASDFRWLRAQQHLFGLTTLYLLVSFLAWIAWLRDREQRLLFWIAVYTAMPLLELVLTGVRLPVSGIWLQFFTQAVIQFREVSQWYVLLWLLQLNGYRRLAEFTRIAACIAIVSGVLDGYLGFLLDRLPSVAFYWTDAALTAPNLIFEAMPAVLVGYAIYRREKLDSARWIVAAFAASSALFYATSNIVVQGCRFTHWTLGVKLGSPLFTIWGSSIAAQAILRTLLFLSIVYAVVRYAIENRKRQASLEQEFQNARELQRVLVPETPPPLKGFALTSAYRPAAEVGGDFFQIIPMAGGSTLIILGDVSGKGLRAAMAVSLIVGATRMIVEYTNSPAEILSGLNRRLYGRLSGGFATAIALRINSEGNCVIASAGHPSPFINQRELELPGALPLGMTADAIYQESKLKLSVGDHCALYTDGLLEARSHAGELYGFGRLETLFASRPDAAQATEAAVRFGQDDDITVLTLTRLGSGEEPTLIFSKPKLAVAK